MPVWKADNTVAAEILSYWNSIAESDAVLVRIFRRKIQHECDNWTRKLRRAIFRLEF